MRDGRGGRVRQEGGRAAGGATRGAHPSVCSTSRLGSTAWSSRTTRGPSSPMPLAGTWRWTPPWRSREAAVLVWSRLFPVRINIHIVVWPVFLKVVEQEWGERGDGLGASGDGTALGAASLGAGRGGGRGDGEGGAWTLGLGERGEEKRMGWVGAFGAGSGGNGVPFYTILPTSQWTT
jgi:hypothetical protein